MTQQIFFEELTSPGWDTRHRPVLRKAGTHGGLVPQNKALFEPQGEFCFVAKKSRQWVAEKLSLDFLFLLHQGNYEVHHELKIGGANSLIKKINYHE